MRRKWLGSFELHRTDGTRVYGVASGASGNAKQRRKTVRRWKGAGYIVTPYLMPEERAA